jgi:hypothetical protein
MGWNPKDYTDYISEMHPHLGSENPNYILNKLKEIDGSGSGLDADTLDGQHASAFLTTSGTAADSNLLDGINSTSFLRSDTDDSFSGNLSSAESKWIKFYHSSETDSNDGKIGAGVFDSGLNIVGAQTAAGTGRHRARHR